MSAAGALERDATGGRFTLRFALQTHNHHRGIPTDLDTHAHAAIYPEAIELAAAALANPLYIPARSTGETIRVPEQRHP